jgi:hypothetical protein
MQINDDGYRAGAWGAKAVTELATIARDREKTKCLLIGAAALGFAVIRKRRLTERILAKAQMLILERVICALAIAIALAATAPLAQAQTVETFFYSYIFSSGDVVSGSFNGTANGNFVDNVSNITVELDGNSFSGPISLTGNISFDALQSYFDLSSSGTPNFFLIYRYGVNFNGASSLANAQFQEMSGSMTHYFPYDAPVQSGNWTLTEVPAPDTSNGGDGSTSITLSP